MKNEIIDKLMEIEEEAKRLDESVLKKQRDNPIFINAKCEEIEKNAENKYLAKYNLERDKIISDNLKKVELIKTEKSIKIEKIEDSFNKNHQEWEEDIFNNIIRW